MADFILWLNDYPLLLAAFIFFARIFDVTLGTMRTISVVRGHRMAAALMGFVEVSVWILAVSGVLKQELTTWKILVYSGGFAAGNITGVWLEQKLALGQQMIILISRHGGRAVAEGLRLSGYIVTELPAKGAKGSVAMCMVIVPRTRTHQVIRIAQQIDPDVLETIEDVRRTRLGSAIGPAAPTGWRAILKKK